MTGSRILISCRNNVQWVLHWPLQVMNCLGLFTFPPNILIQGFCLQVLIQLFSAVGYMKYFVGGRLLDCNLTFFLWQCLNYGRIWFYSLRNISEIMCSINTWIWLVMLLAAFLLLEKLSSYFRQMGMHTAVCFWLFNHIVLDPMHWSLKDVICSWLNHL